jgi:hypothetical protein
MLDLGLPSPATPSGLIEYGNKPSNKIVDVMTAIFIWFMEVYDGASSQPLDIPYSPITQQRGSCRVHTLSSHLVHR